MQAKWLDNEENISAETLVQQGILNEVLNPADRETPIRLEKLKADRGYVEQDEVTLSLKTEGLEQICAKFIDEHLHDDDEVRYVLDGAGVFDIRSTDDRWMRVRVDKGDLIVVPKNRYHRFMLTDEKNIHCVRLFKDQNGWEPRYRNQS